MQAKNLKGEALTIQHGVEPDPRSALDSEGDQKGLPGNSIIHDMMEPEHAQWIRT